MANTFTTNYNLTKPEVGGANDTWGELVNTNYTTLDSEIFKKADKNDQKGVTHNLTFAAGTVTTNVTRGFASYNVNDKITISNSSTDADNKGEFKIEGITNDITLDLVKTDDSEPNFSSETISSTVSIISEINKIEGSLDVSADTLTTSTAQNNAIIEGSTTSELGMRFLFKSSANNSSGNLDLNLSSYSYDHYKIAIKGLLPASGTPSIKVYLGTSSTTFATSEGDYNGAGMWNYWTGFTASSGAVGESAYERQNSLIEFFHVASGTGGGFYANLDLFNPHSTSKNSVGIFSAFELDLSSNNVNNYNYSGGRQSATNDSYVRISSGSTNLSEGTVSVYGIGD